MDTMHAPAPARDRWFAGLRRSDSRILGGVAAGLAEFWAMDPLLVRVLAVSPVLAAVLAYSGQVALGLYWTVPVTQLLWLGAAATVAGYLLGWALIPRSGSDSVARRFLAWGGMFGVLVKLVVGVVALIAVGWLGLAGLALLGALDGVSPLLYVLGMLVAVGGLALLGVWLARGGDLRDALHRFGSPGFGRTDATAPADWSEHVAPGADHTLVLDADAEHTIALPVPTSSAGDPTMVLGSVDRARAAATAAADARAAAAEAARRARAEQRRARRAERRERNRWGWLVAAAALITAGVLVLTDRAGATSLGPSGIGLVCLGLLTAGVLVGAWFGSARWLIAPALLLAGVIGAGALATDALERAEAAPPITVAPTSLPTDGTSMGWAEGAVTVDLTGTKELDARGLGLSVDRGSLTVIIPTGQWTEISSSVTLGRTSLDPRGLVLASSTYQTLNQPPGEPEREAAPLFLGLAVGVGELTVIEQES